MTMIRTNTGTNLPCPTCADNHGIFGNLLHLVCECDDCIDSDTVKTVCQCSFCGQLSKHYLNDLKLVSLYRS